MVMTFEGKDMGFFAGYADITVVGLFRILYQQAVEMHTGQTWATSQAAF